MAWPRKMARLGKQRRIGEPQSRTAGMHRNAPPIRAANKTRFGCALRRLLSYCYARLRAAERFSPRRMAPNGLSCADHVQFHSSPSCAHAESKTTAYALVLFCEREHQSAARVGSFSSQPALEVPHAFAAPSGYETSKRRPHSPPTVCVSGKGSHATPSAGLLST